MSRLLDTGVPYEPPARPAGFSFPPAVIPGRAEGASPEPMRPEGEGGAPAESAVVMGSGPRPEDDAAIDDDYAAFLQSKIRLAQPAGFEVDLAEVNPALKPHARAIAHWAVNGGRRAIFSSFGLGKTTMQLEIMRLVRARSGGPTLTVLPLGVRQEFRRDAERFFAGAHEVRTKFIRSAAEIDPDPRVHHLTNYETVRDGKLDPALFAGASLDEADVLRGFGGSKTFRELLRLFERVHYRFVATATPSPNEFIELLAYAAFLDIMDVGQAKTRFFKRDSEQADALTLHPHKEREFWLWVASWAIFLDKPSDLGFSDDGYDLPPLEVRWHEIATDHAGAGVEKDGQGRMFRNAAINVQSAAREKRDSLAARVAKLQEIRAEDPAAHRIIWHDLEAERAAIEAAIPTVRSVFGSQDLDEREATVIGFSEGEFAELAAKPSVAGTGCNFQRHCAWAVCLGIGFKFRDFFQAVHRILRFGQERTCRLDLIYTEAEREVRRSLEDKWGRHLEMAQRMREIVREYGLAQAAIAGALKRSIGVERREASGAVFAMINNDSVIETASLQENSVDLIVTSIPFETQYEYTPSYNDFGHTETKAEFWRQMDYLTPQLLRVLKPGRIAAIHVKDRIVPGGMTGLGFQTISPTSDDCSAHFRKHGFALLARKTIVTDVVRENNQTYRLGWTEQCKDGSRMGAGLPEYLLIFRKPPTDRSNGYADEPVAKQKPLSHDDDGNVVPYEAGKSMIPGTGYSRARWQIDAHGFTRSNGNRFLAPEDLVGLEADAVWKLWKQHSLAHAYDFEHHVACCEARERRKELPKKFMLMPPHSWHPDVWSDITRMRTLNLYQSNANKQMHLCPLQFDIVDRAIAQFSQEGEVVLDPFAGLGTVPYCAIRLKRRGLGVELNPDYWRDGVGYCEAAAAEMAVPTLIDLLRIEEREGLPPAISVDAMPHELAALAQALAWDDGPEVAEAAE